jgi:hypothetical protein
MDCQRLFGSALVFFCEYLKKCLCLDDCSPSGVEIVGVVTCQDSIHCYEFVFLEVKSKAFKNKGLSLCSENDQNVKSVKKPPVSNMTPPFTAFAKTDRKYTYSQVGVASSKKTNAPQKLSKRKQNWNAQLGAATAHFEMDPTFLSLSTGAGPSSRIYRWLTAQQSQIETYCGFLLAAGTPSQWDEKVANGSSFLTRFEIKSLSPMLEVFTKRFGAQKSIIRTQESKEAGFL